jgi:hypothetical protein
VASLAQFHDFWYGASYKATRHRSIELEQNPTLKRMARERRGPQQVSQGLGKPAAADPARPWGPRGTGPGKSPRLICRTMRPLLVKLYIELDLIV